jgi:hypothetical protein
MIDPDKQPGRMIFKSSPDKAKPCLLPAVLNKAIDNVY